ncbi:HNH endonuclease [Rhodoferax ferrireducens T118]|uniref:HNH endonuclease n=1 Tax=Albidiferax ferrireducens (strain ATCC BAA-621 / DSM 15236 / T118) TaxID=338969 RepID=Q21Z76_ALBFT|nr:HNH endonuclease signature motif containing protein [Rhodoferax ferrireducens]ABD68927.1 HNH endonuclease [Rhodoferax ferrireducens T118]
MTTEDFLLGMGADTSSAQNLSMRLSTADIEAMNTGMLEELGLTKRATQAIKNKRPPIPVKNLRSVLDANFYVCCVCKDRNRNVVVHHIQPYAQSKDHACSNLAVLCLMHHSEEHLTRDQTQNLTSDKIASCKKSWEAETIRIKADIATAQRERPWNEPCRWDWVNFPRVVDTLRLKGLKAADGYGYDELFKSGIVDKSGGFVGTDWQNVKVKDNDYFSAGKQQLEIAAHVGQMLELIGQAVPIFDLTSWLSICPSFIRGCLVEGDFISVKASFVYHKAFDGAMIATAETEAWRISFEFDPWYCLSSTSRLNYYTTTPVNQSLFGIVRSVVSQGGKQVLSISPLGTSPTFAPHRPRFGDWIDGTRPTADGGT